ncbi:hypothetical protein ZWY2020_056406 [Hordeum vulgare]|nr:hypothetical protein ZWY2020_056406 [Hordeum vulgare]
MGAARRGLMLDQWCGIQEDEEVYDQASLPPPQPGRLPQPPASRSRSRAPPTHPRSCRRSTSDALRRRRRGAPSPPRRRTSTTSAPRHPSPLKVYNLLYRLMR